MKKVQYTRGAITKYVEAMKEPLRHQISDAMQLGIPREYLELLTKETINFPCRAYLIGCMLDQEKEETLRRIAELDNPEEMLLERKRIQEQYFFKNSPIWEEYQKMAELCREQSRRVSGYEQMYQKALDAIRSSCPDETKGELPQKGTEEQTKVKDELQRLLEKTERMQAELEKVQTEKEELQRRLLCRMQESAASGQEPQKYELILAKQKQPLLFSRLTEKIMQRVRARFDGMEKEKKVRFLKNYLREKTEHPEQIDLLMECYREGWTLKELEKIAACETLEEMRKKKEGLERVRKYQAMLGK